MRIRFLGVKIGIGLALLSGAFLLWRRHPEIALENQFLENLQASFLLFALVAALLSLRGAGQAPPYIPQALSVFFLTLLLREVDLEKLDLPALLVTCGSGDGRRLLLSLLWGGVLFLVFRHRCRLKADISTFFRSPLAGYLVAGTLLYLVADLFDKKIIPFDRALSLLAEEALEGLGTLCFAAGSAAWAITARRPRIEVHQESRVATDAVR